MATIDKDGVYTIKGQEADVRFQFLKGHQVPDDVEYVRVGDIEQAGAKADEQPANKAAVKPENKAAK
jgi:hypothetical protein